MQKTSSKLRPARLTDKQLRQLRKDRELIARELPDLIAKHERIRGIEGHRRIPAADRHPRLAYILLIILQHGKQATGPGPSGQESGTADLKVRRSEKNMEPPDL